MTPPHAAARVLIWVCLFSPSVSRTAEVYQAQGEMAGEPTSRTVLLQSRLTAVAGPDLDEAGDIHGKAGVVRFEWSRSEDFAGASATEWLTASAERDFIVRASVENLEPGTRYFYRVISGESRETARPGPTRQFRTLPERETNGPVSFCMGSCMNYHSFMAGKANGGGPVTATAEDKRLGYPAFAAMAALKPDFFIGTGDIVYYDHPPQTAAKTLPELRRKWHEQFRFPRMIDFFGRTPAYWSKDDHDFRFNDADLSGGKEPAPATGIEIFREQMPIHPSGDDSSPTYRTHRVHRDLQLWFVEGRDFRSPNRQPDGPEKTIWGREQREWLQRTLKESDATWKVIVTPTPMVGPDRNSKVDNHTNLAGFKHEADAFFQYLQDEEIGNVLTFCGDRHWQYHSIHPKGVEEFSVGALNDENAIRGEKPGGPKTTDPEGQIRQPYLYPEPTGGFLHVTVDGGGDGSDPRLRLTFHDDLGAVLYRVEKAGRRP
ncbi:MAG: alkaline phosphatase D family protein [Verrucomicrobiales bacterium]|nr:alkaline phosphatase D family protein [Verrucomicrobiales bacterium]